MRLTENITVWFCRIPLFWRFQIVGWTVYACLTFPLKAVLYDSVPYALLVTVFRESYGFLASSCLRLLYVRLGLRTDRPLRMAVVILAASFVAAALDILLGFWIEDFGGRTGGLDPTFGIFCFRALLLTVWSLLYFAIRDLMAARKRLLRLRKAEAAARDAEILMLRAQVSPHFLFNAFNTILAELDGRNPELVPVVRGLSDYFRYSLSNHNEVFVTMGQEYDAIRSYLTVEKARFQDSLEIDCHLDEEAREVRVPGVFLQPLVENALKYGHMTSPTPLRLRLNVTCDADARFIVEVTNSGKWVERSKQRKRSDSEGHGLSVLRRRLELLYPGNHSLEIIAPEEAEDVTVRICLPSVKNQPITPDAN